MLRALVLAPGRWTLPEIDAAIDRLRQEGHLIEAKAARSDRAFVTDRAVTAERTVVRWMKKQSDAPGSFVIDADLVERHLEAGTLNDGQKAAVNTLLLSARHAVGVQGHAGTGKTTMLRQVVELAGAERIVALAPSSSAARTLERETGIGTKTLQWFLTRYRDVGDGCADARTLAQAREVLESSLLVVDEASLISMAQMHSLTRIAEATGIARVALVGDRAQLRAVEAGQPFRVLQKAGMETAVMDEVLRQRDESLKAAVLHMIEGKPELAVRELGPGVLEMDSDELGPRAAALWLDLDREARDATKVLAPTHARRREITQSIREGLKAEGSLHGRTLQVERYVNLHLTRAQKGDLDNWREGDVAVFHADVYGVQAKSGDIFGVIGSEGEKVLLKHPDGKTRRVDPSKYLRYRVELFETEPIELQAGERIRWTRNDKKRDLLNGEEARILSIGKKSLRLQAADGRTLTLAHNDPQLHFIDHAWTSTVHAAQGMTCDQVIAVLDANQGAITGQAAFYVELTRARDNAVLLTDDRDGLVEALETAAGDELSALEAIGHQFRDETPTAMAAKRLAVAEKKAIPPTGLTQAKAWRDDIRATLESHLDDRLAEREVLLVRARHPRMDDNEALAGTQGHDAWRDQALATAGACRELTDEGGIAERADLLEQLVVFDDRVGAFNRDRQRHAQAARAAGEDVVFWPGIEDLVSRGRTIVDEAPRPDEVPWDLLNYLDMVTDSWDRADAEADGEAMAEFDRVERNVDAVKEERRRLSGLADGRPLHSEEGYEPWRERTVVAIDEWERANVWEGERQRTYLVETRRLQEAMRYDHEVATLLADWADHENRASTQGMDALDIAANDPLLTRVRQLVDTAPEGEAPPQALTAILSRRQARIEERENAAGRIAQALDDHAAVHARYRDNPSLQTFHIGLWCAGTKLAIASWHASTGTAGRDPALSEKARVLEDIIAFEERARGLDTRWREVGGTSHPFTGTDGETLASDLRALQRDLPRHGVLLASLRQALEALDAHERAQARDAELKAAAAAITRGLDDYRARHASMPGTDKQRDSIRDWCTGTKEAIGTWRAMTEPDRRDPVLSESAAVLESLIAFEERARDLDARWREAGGTEHPFRRAGGDALARDLRALEAGIPRHGVMLMSLRTALVALDAHERTQAQDAELKAAAATIARGLDDYRALHAPMQDASKQLRHIRVWCGEMREAVRAWRAMTDPGERDPALSEKAAVLESLIGFEERAWDVSSRWWRARQVAGRASPFFGAEGDSLARDLKRLETDRPPHSIIPRDLQAPLAALAEHEKSAARVRELLRRAAEVDNARRSLLEREGRKSRPLNRRLNRAWKRWRETAEAVAADIDAADAALIAHIDTDGVAARVGAEHAASDRLDGLPGWLLLRLHDNARDAGSAMHPAMTEAYAGIIDEMRRFDDRLKPEDPRVGVIRGEVHAHRRLQETRRKVAELLWELTVHNARVSSLENAAGREALPLRQSLAWAQWYNTSRSLEEQARKVLAGGGDHGRALHDGQGTRRSLEEEIVRFARTRAAHGEPDNSARLARIRKESEEERQQQRHRGRGFSP